MIKILSVGVLSAFVCMSVCVCDLNARRCVLF